MTDLQHARALMGDSLGFHINFALFGVGLPLATFLVEWWAIRLQNDHLMAIAKTLSRVMVLFAVVGVASGTLISVQMSVFWPGLIAFGSKIIGVPFMLEGYAFLLEAVFLAFYASTWKRVHGMKHVLLLIPVIVGAFLSAVCITLANAWMNDPHGFELVNGAITNVQVWHGLITKTAFFEISHSIVSYYMATFLCVAGVLVWSLWKYTHNAERAAALVLVVRRFLVIGIVCAVLLAILGDASLRYLAKSEPRKFAALEFVTKTATHVPYRIGSHVNEETMEDEGGVQFENVLSMMTGFSNETEITGLQAYPKQDWPLLIIGTLFEIKMALVGFITLVPIAFLLLLRYRKPLADSRLMRIFLIACGPITVVVIELGWMVTELGRQPFAVSGYLRTADAFTANVSVLQWGMIFPLTFVLLIVVTTAATRKLIHKPQQ